MTSKFAKYKATLAWAKKSTENITFDPILAEAFAEILDDYIEALQFCSGSADFAPEGQARDGWEKLVVSKELI